jgi:hypothetical protein
MKSSTAVIATLAAGMVLLTATGHANAKGGNGNNGRQGQGTAANSAAADSAAKTTPVYTCLACRFVKRDGTDKLERKVSPGRDMPARDMVKRDGGGKLADKQDKARDGKQLDDGKRKVPQPVADKPGASGSGGPTGGTPPVTSARPIPNTNPAAGGTVTISNGATNSKLLERPGGLLVTSPARGKITVSNGASSVTLPGESVTLSGAVSVGAGSGLQMIRQPNGDIAVRAGAPPSGTITFQAPAPARPVAPPATTAGKKGPPLITGTVTGSSDGVLSDIGGAIKDVGKAIGRAAEGATTPATAGPDTSTITQQ